MEPLTKLPVDTMKEPIQRPLQFELRRPRWPRFEPDTTIVIPVMNESANILPLVHRIQAACRGLKLVVHFIDDSRDARSVEMAMLARMMYRNHEFDVRILHRIGAQRWGGLSGAVTDGISISKSNRIIVMDGDLQHPPETIPSMIHAGQHFDIVMASRYRKGGSASGLDGGIRHLVSRASTELAKFLFPIRLAHVSDPMTGFFLIDKSKVDTTRLRPKGFKILLEILGTHPKLSVADVPLQFAERLAGASKGTMKQGTDYLSQLAYLRFNWPIRTFTSLPKFFQFGSIGGGVFVIGMVMLHILVVAGMHPLMANAIQLIVTFVLNYQLNRLITWREREISPRAAQRFLVSRTATTILNYAIFAGLIGLGVGIGYIAANIITLLAITILNYVISDRWAFAEPKPARIPLQNTASSPMMTAALQAAAGTAPATPPPIVSYAPSWDTAPAITKTYQAQPDRFSPTVLVAKRIIYGLITIALFASAALMVSPAQWLLLVLAVASFGLFLQSCFEVGRMAYTYRDPESVDRMKFPVPQMDKLQERFMLIVPARHESEVLAHTLLQLDKQTHPNVDIYSVMCDDDTDTLAIAYQAASRSNRIHVIAYPLPEGTKPSKPLQLNYVLDQTAGKGYTAVGIFDAEDTVHPELLAHVDAAFRENDADVVQGGVQLMNHGSSWFALHNVLEYYRWFNSAMSFNADKQFMPLGGNTIFIRDALIREAGGWPLTLTEDCSLGVLLSTRYRAKTAVFYEARLATREETPDTLQGLFKQRVRWNQGFFNEWRKGTWRQLPTLRQRVLANYVLSGPLLFGLMNIFLTISLFTIFFLKTSVILSMLMYLPLVPAALMAVMNGLFLHDFGKVFNRKITIRQYFTLFATQYFYQIVLNLAAFWSVIRDLRGETSWYKTPHIGLHRTEDEELFPEPELQPGLAYAFEPVYAGSANERGDGNV